jgi:hypothetical protein
MSVAQLEKEITMVSNAACDPTAVQPWDGCLVGTLETWPLADMVQWLHQTHGSAMIQVGLGTEAGILCFSQGDLYRCEWGDLVGEEAVMALFALQSGTFSLIHRDLPKTAVPNISLPTAELLFQLAIARGEPAPVGEA